jgi:VWFA-related protein
MSPKLPSFLLPAVLALAVTGSPQDKPQADPKTQETQKPADTPKAPEAATAQDSTPTFPAQVEQVIVDVVVMDKKGNAVTDLTQADISVTEDGAPQSITSFERVQLEPLPADTKFEKPRVSTNMRPENRTGRTFAVVFDDMHLTPFQAQRAKGAVANFLETGTAAGDLVTLVATSGAAWWSTRMPQGRDELVATLKRLDGRYIPDTSIERMSDYEAMMIHVLRDSRTIERVNRRYDTYGVNPQGRQSSSNTGSGNNSFGADADPQVTARAAEVYYSATSRNRTTLDTLERLLNALKNARGRKSLILVSEGFIYDPNLTEFKQVVQAARRSNVAIYFLDTRGLQGMSVYNTAEFGPALDTQDLGAAFMENMEEAEGAESISSDSGGFSVKNTNDLTKGIQRIAAESRNYYLVGYVSQNAARDGKFRKIAVKVTRKDVQVRARKGYYAPQDGVKPPPKKPGPDPVLQAAVDSPFELDQIPLRMSAYVFDETILGKAATLILTDIDLKAIPFEEKDGRLVNSIQFLLVASHRETGEFFQYDQRVDMKLQPKTKEKMNQTWYPVVKDFELPPGSYQAKIVVRELNSNHVGTVVHEFEVPDLAKFHTSTPVVTDTLQPAPEGSKDRPHPMPLARRVFPTGSTVFCSLEVYGAAKDKASGMPRVSMGYLIRSKDGTTFARVDPTVIAPTSLGKLSRMLGSGMAEAAAGDYELVIKLKDEVSGEGIELVEPFSLMTPTTAEKPAAP